MNIRKSAIHVKEIFKDRLLAISYIARPAQLPDDQRYNYQKQFIKHNFVTGEKILDIGSGNDPFPYSTLLADRFLETTRHRSDEFKTDGKPVIICDICELPFKDHAFDYVTAIHILEHLEDPIKACRDLQRVAKAGYIEVPTLMKDSLFCWAKGMHLWNINAIDNTLIFLEYSNRQLDGINSLAWRNLIFSTLYNPIQKAFNGNQDLFNVMFEWETQFDVIVIKQDGTMKHLKNGKVY